MASKFKLNGVEVQKESAKAVLITAEDLLDEVWVPKSVIDDDSDVWDASPDGCGPGTLTVSFWYAEKQGWA